MRILLDSRPHFGQLQHLEIEWKVDRDAHNDVNANNKPNDRPDGKIAAPLAFIALILWVAAQIATL